MWHQSQSQLLLSGLSTRVNTKTIFDSLQCFQRRVCLFKGWGHSPAFEGGMHSPPLVVWGHSHPVYLVPYTDHQSLMTPPFLGCGGHSLPAYLLHYDGIKWPSWPVNRMFVHQFVLTNNKETSKFHFTVSPWGEPLMTKDYPHKGTVTQKMVPFGDIVMFELWCCILI